MEEAVSMEHQPHHEQHHSKDEHIGKGANLQLIVFKLAGEEYAMLIDQIKEVVITPKIAKVPLTPNYIRGVANIRGNILAIIDLVERFSLGSPSTSSDNQAASNFTLVVESNEYKMGILVKDVPNTLSVYETDIDNSPSIINDSSGIDNNYIKGIVKSGSRMIVLIDIHKVINKDEIHRVIKEKSA